MNFQKQALVFIVLSPLIWLAVLVLVNTKENKEVLINKSYKSIISSSPTQLSKNLTKISSTIWVYTAYVDITSDNETIVTIFSVADGSIKKQPIECKIDLIRGESIITLVNVVKIEDRYHLKYDLWKVQCNAGSLLSTQPVSVTISSIDFGTVHLSVERKLDYVGKIGCCLAGPLWRSGSGDKGVMDLISWVEFQRLLGVERTIVYAMKQEGDVREVLDHYVREGFVAEIEWNFPISNRDFRYFGQNLLLNDCLYKSRDLFNYTIFIDLDETIVPVSHKNLVDLLDNQTESTISAFGFTNRFHHTHWR